MVWNDDVSYTKRWPFSTIVAFEGKLIKNHKKISFSRNHVIFCPLKHKRFSMATS